MNIKRHLLFFLLCSVLLCGCISEEGGMSGTGINTVTSGRITALDSVSINGVSYNTEHAVFYRDGLVASGPNEFNIGEFVTVTGTINLDTREGMARELHFENNIHGFITALPVSGQELEVMGRRVLVDPLTVFHGFDRLADLKLNDVVQVSGFDHIDGRILTASSIRVPGAGSSTMLRVSGQIMNLLPEQQIFDLGNLQVDYSQAELTGFFEGVFMLPGMSVQIEAPPSSHIIDGVLTVSSVTSQVLSIRPDVPAGSYLELEGTAVENIPPRSDAVEDTKLLSINGQLVELTEDTKFFGVDPDNLAQEGQILEVEGVLENGILQAVWVGVRSVSQEQCINVQGAIESIDYEQLTLTVFQDTFQLSSTSLLLGANEAEQRRASLSFDQFAVGDWVSIEAVRLGQHGLNVLRLDKGASAAAGRCW